MFENDIVIMQLVAALLVGLTQAIKRVVPVQFADGLPLLAVLLGVVTFAGLHFAEVVSDNIAIALLEGVAVGLASSGLYSLLHPLAPRLLESRREME